MGLDVATVQIRIQQENKVLNIAEFYLAQNERCKNGLNPDVLCVHFNIYQSKMTEFDFTRQFQNLVVQPGIRIGEDKTYRFPIYAGEQELWRRRYSEFAFFRQTISRVYLGCIIPSLPEKEGIGENIRSYFTDERSEFMERRRFGLEKFLQYIIGNQTLKNWQEVQEFLTLGENDYAVLVQKYTQAANAGVFNALYDVGASLVSYIHPESTNTHILTPEDEAIAHFQGKLSSMKQSLSQLQQQISDEVQQAWQQQTSSSELVRVFGDLYTADCTQEAYLTLAQYHEKIRQTQIAYMKSMDHLATKDLPELQRLLEGAIESIEIRLNLKCRIETERLNSKTPSQKMERMLDDLTT